MRVGVLILPTETWQDSALVWRDVEELGFAHAWTFDHLSWRGAGDREWYTSFPTLAAAARCTESIGLGPLVASPSLRHPLVLAKDAITLNDLSGGRALLAVGSGVGSNDEHMLDIHLTPSSRRSRLKEFILVTRRLFSGETVTFRGDYFSLCDARLRPAGHGSEQIPLGIAAAGPASIDIAAEDADIWVTNGHRRPDGSLHSDPAILSAQHTNLERALARVGRDPRSIRRLAAIVDWQVPLLRTAETFGAAAMALGRTGFTDLVIPYPRRSPPFKYPYEVFKSIASDILPELIKNYPDENWSSP